MSDTQRHLNSDLEVVVSIRLLGLEETGLCSKEDQGPDLPHPFSGRTPWDP